MAMYKLYTLNWEKYLTNNVTVYSNSCGTENKIKIRHAIVIINQSVLKVW